MNDTKQKRGIARGLLDRWGWILLIGLTFAGGWYLRGGLRPVGTRSGTEEHASGPGRTAPATIWTCSMDPQIQLPEPGDCPICGMDLIPLEPRDASKTRPTVVLTESDKERMRIRTSPVERRSVEATIRMFGKIDYDETQLATITARVAGRIDRLFVDYTGVQVAEGDHLVNLFSPKLYVAQTELLQALKAAGSALAAGGPASESAERTLSASRERLAQLGLTAEQIIEVEERGTPSDNVTLFAPQGGIVVEKPVRQGMHVAEGTEIIRIADLRKLWVVLDAYETDLVWLRYGQHVEFETKAVPGELFTGTIAFINPVLDDATRTVKVRVNVPNENGLLKPNMFVKAVVRPSVAGGGRMMDLDLAGKWICPMHPEVVADEAGACDACGMALVTTESRGYAPVPDDDAELPLVIPTTAVLATGKRAIVFVELEDSEAPEYEAREIRLGSRAGEWQLVESGLSEGEHVVTHGNFKLDSALQIRAETSMMTPPPRAGTSDE